MEPNYGDNFEQQNNKFEEKEVEPTTEGLDNPPKEEYYTQLPPSNAIFFVIDTWTKYANGQGND